MMTNADPFRRLFVQGAGSWGTALALLGLQTGAEVVLWTRREDHAAAMRGDRENQRYLPGVSLPPALTITADRGAIAGCDAVLSVVPAQFAGGELAALREASGAAALPVALCSKGIEAETRRLMPEVLKAAWPEAAPAMLSGPSFAADVAKGLPTAVTLADADRDRGERWLATLGTLTFRPYWSADLTGVAIGGAVKNVLAVACGVVEGQGLGESARAALMARGFAEAARFAVALGAKVETLRGLSGLGDMILTCVSPQSRNYSLGVALGQGETAADILSKRHTVAEGAKTAPVLTALAREHGVEMPVAEAVAALVAGDIEVDDVVDSLLSRPLRPESPLLRDKT